MKWTTLFKDFKEKVGLSPSVPSSPSSATGNNVSSPASDLSSSPSRDRLGLELDFKRYWEEFRSSSSEKEKETTLNLTIDSFCRLVKKHTDVTQLVSMLVETHIFSFVVGRAFVTDIEKLKIRNKTKSLSIAQVVIFFSEITKDDICPGSNLLNAVEVLVSGGHNNPIDRQSLLDSGILCCLIQILDSLMGNVKPNQEKSVECESNLDTPHSDADFNRDGGKAHQLEIEGSVVHIMKALASHPSAAQSLIEDDSLQLLFQMVANGSLTVFALHKDGLIPLHTIQLHRHSMQILGLLLANDSGCTAKYIRKHHLIKVLLLAVRDFNPNCGDSAYTLGIIDLLLECVELSYRPEADGIRLREDIHNAHGYQFLVQFALILSTIPSESVLQPTTSDISLGSVDVKVKDSNTENPDLSLQLLPTLSRLLDVLVNLAQAGLSESVRPIGSKTQKYSKGKTGVHSRGNASSSSERIVGQFWEKGNSKVKDLEAVQMLQDIFLKAESRELQAEVLNRLFKIFSSHSENYKLSQQLKTLPLFILNMASFPSNLQEIILKILEYAVTVVNCIPEQELLSLCCLLEQPINSELKHTIVSFFVKLLSFDQKYKKILREVGVLDIMLDDLKKQRFLLSPGQSNADSDGSGNGYRENSLPKHLENSDVIISSSSSSKRMMESGSGRFPLFEIQETIAISWDCVVALLKKTETNQAFFRSASGVVTILPFLASDAHRSGVLRALSCLIIEDSRQEHAEEISAIVDVLKSGIVTTTLGYQYSTPSDAKCDILGALWRILGANSAAQRVFGEVTGFSLFLTVIHSFQCEGELLESPSQIKLFTYLVRVITAGVRENAVNRLKLHSIIHSPTFCDLLTDSGIVCVEFEKQVIHLFFELAIELVIPPFMASVTSPSVDEVDDTSSDFFLRTPSGPFNPERERVYNAGAVRVLIHCLFHFTPKVQLHVLNFIEKLASIGPFNQEALTSVGCVELLLATIKPLISCSSPVLHRALKIVEVLGAYRLSASELRVILRYVLQMGHTRPGRNLISMVERMILMEDYDSDHVPLAPFVEMDMRKCGHASVQVSLGERSWPPTSGYSFVCWFQFHNFFNFHSKESDSSNMHKRRGSSFVKNPGSHVFRIFSVASADATNTVYAELYLQEDGLLVLATSTSSFLSFSGLDLVEGKWHNLAVVHSKPNALAGLFHSSVASVYLDGKLKHTGKLGYSISPFGKSIQVTVGIPSTYARMSSLSWKLRSCHLFEEVLTPGCICFMYILGRGYRGIFQDSDLLRFVPDHACGGDSMAILDTLDVEMLLVPHIQKGESGGNGKQMMVDGSGIVWDTDRLGSLSLQLSWKKLIFAFDGTCIEPSRASGALAMLNLVDPLSAAASPIGGIPRFGRLHGDVFPCGQSVISDSIHPLGGMTVVLALIEAAETRDMLHMALTLLASTLHQNPLNVRDMKRCRGYHLLALFLHRRMPLFDMQSLEIFFQIAACEASFSEPKKARSSTNTVVPSSSENVFEPGFEDISISRSHDEMSSSGSHVDLDEFSAQKDSFGRISELENGDFSTETSNCVVLSNPDMVEHVLLDWTLWVTAPISIQISLLGFLEHLVSMHWYRSHNLTILRQINLVQHLLVTLQRGDVEIPVLEKLVVLLGVILEDGFLTTELEYVVRFVVMTFDPQEVKPSHRIARESMGKHVIVRNMLLEMLIDLQVTIKTEELLEQWHKIVSSKLITYFLDEAVHPTSMRWVMTLLGVCLASSLTFSVKFRTSGGFQGLTRVLCSFYDAPDIYYILFCVLFSRPVYPRLPEVRMLDFHALIQSDGTYVELRFIELLDSVIAMAKSVFDMLSVKSMLVHENGGFSKASGAVVSEIEEGGSDAAGELQGEALMHKTYAARLMGGESSAPSTATSLLRFMVDLAKICRPFSSVCKRPEFMESCVDLYFSCIRAAFAVKKAKDKSKNTEEIDMNDSINTSQKAVSTSIGSFPSGKASSSSADKPLLPDGIDDPIKGNEYNIIRNLDNKVTTLSLADTDPNNNNNQMDSQTSLSLTIPDSPNMSEKSSFGLPISSIPSPVVALASWLGSGTKSSSLTTSSMASSSMPTTEFDQPSDLKKSASRGPSSTNTFPPINSNFLLQVDDVGYGGGPCSAAATAVLDFMSEVLSDMMTDQMKAVQVLENVLESVPLHVETDCVFAFQGLCLSRLLIFLERRLVCDDEGGGRKLDKIRWSQNLDGLSWMIVNRVYMGAFPQAASVLKIVEFLLSMLQLSNKEGLVEEAGVNGKGILAIGRGPKQVDAHVHSLLKNTNRILLYCFLPSFLLTIGEADLVSSYGMQNEYNSKICLKNSGDDGGIDVCSLLQLLIAHRRIIFCHRNVDTDLNSCLCVNLTSLLRDQRMQVRNMAVDVLKYLLVHRRAGMEDILVSKPSQGRHLDAFHGGFDLLLAGGDCGDGFSLFFDWFWASQQMVNKVLEQCAGVMWAHYIAGSKKFPTVNIKGVEGRRKREMARKYKEALKIDIRHLEQVNERRYALEVVREALSTELRMVRQDKYGWVLHAESEWQTLVQQLVHERGVFPSSKGHPKPDPEWQLCLIEGPYRMRRKLERRLVKTDTIRNSIDRQSPKENSDDVFSSFDAESDLFFHNIMETDDVKSGEGVLKDADGPRFEDSEDLKDVASARSDWNDDLVSSGNEASLYSFKVVGRAKSSALSVSMSESGGGQARVGDMAASPFSASMKLNEPSSTSMDMKVENKDSSDNGEYLIRPYLEPFEKIRSKYNCERVVGLDKHDGIFLIGEISLYVIENFYIDESGCIWEKEYENELSVIDQALGVNKNVSGSSDFLSPSTNSSWEPVVKPRVGGKVWAYNGGAWGKEKLCSSGTLSHLWRMWHLSSVQEILKRDYQLRPVAIEIFSMDGCNDLLVFHKKEREEIFKNLISMNLSRNNMLDTIISGSSKQEIGEGGSRLFKLMAKSFSKRWESGEISNFQYLMHLNTLAGRGYSDLTQYPVFPWVLADYESEHLDLSNPLTFRSLDKPMGCQTAEGEEEFRKRYESWDDPEVPKFHYGSHYSSAGIVLFFLLRLPPFSSENQKLQGGQFDHADRLFNSVKDTWLSAAGRGNTSDVKELIPEFFYIPEFLENRFNLDLGEKQSGEKVGDVALPPWAKKSAREFIRKHREALECDFVSQHLHHWIDLIFGYKQRGKAAEEAVNVFYHYTYEGSVDIDSVTDPGMKASILAQINHFGQTPKQLFFKPHPSRRSFVTLPPRLLLPSSRVAPHEIRKTPSLISHIVSTPQQKILVAGPSSLLKPPSFTKYISWGFPDLTLRLLSSDHHRLLSTHENLHGPHPITCVALSLDGLTLVTAAADALLSVWRFLKKSSGPGSGPGPGQHAHLLRPEKSLSAHTGRVTCLRLSQPQMLIVSGSDDRTVIFWDLRSLSFVRQLPEFPSPVTALYVNDSSGEVVTAAGVVLAVWTVNGDCLSVVSSSQLPSDSIISVTGWGFPDWVGTEWVATGHQSGAVKVWRMEHQRGESGNRGEYRLMLQRVLKAHKFAVTALCMSGGDGGQLLSGDAGGHLMAWTVDGE